MGKQKYAMTSEKPRPVDDVRASLANQLDERRKLFGRVLEIRVLNNHEFTAHGAESGAQRRPLPSIFRLQQQREPKLSLKARENVTRPVG
jgi:hypothetical protein